MSEHDLILKLEEIAKRLESQQKNKTDWFKVMVSVFGIMIVTVIFSAGILWGDFQELKDNQINKHDWEDNEYKTNATYNRVFEIPLEYQIRGGMIK